jgi:catechol 2,3-dioxygenase-like lactoylglutathione lyase family enzyme
MLHHISFAVADLKRSATFYDAALAPLGYVRVFTQESGAGRKESAVGYGRPGAEDEFAIRARQEGVVPPGDGFHVAFRSPSQEAATSFYQAALAQGGRDNGGVGFHPEHGANYFAAFVFDPDGYRIEAVVDEKALATPAD